MSYTPTIIMNRDQIERHLADQKRVIEFCRNLKSKELNPGQWAVIHLHTLLVEYYGSSSQPTIGGMRLMLTDCEFTERNQWLREYLDKAEIEYTLDN